MTSGSELAAMEGRKFGLDQAMTGLSFVLLLIIVAIPIFMIVYNAFFYENKFDISLFVSVIGNVDNLKAMWNTIVIALAVTLFGTIMGLFYAWLLGRSDIPAKGFMRAMFTIPYMFPPFFGAMAWDLLFSGRAGYVNKWLMATFHLASAPININSIGGITFCGVLLLFPICVHAGGKRPGAHGPHLGGVSQDRWGKAGAGHSKDYDPPGKTSYFRRSAFDPHILTGSFRSAVHSWFFQEYLYTAHHDLRPDL